MKRITDLDEFSLTHVWRPYQTLVGYQIRLKRPPHGLDETAKLLKRDNDWSRSVLDRITAIGFSFPEYIKHPLVDVINQAQSNTPTKKR